MELQITGWMENVYVSHTIKQRFLFYQCSTALMGLDLPIVEDSRSHSMWQATLGRTPLDVWYDRRRDLYQITHNTHERQTTLHPARFESDNPRKLQTHALYRAATRIGKYRLHSLKYNLITNRKLSWILRCVWNPTEHLVQSIRLLVIQRIKKKESYWF